MALSLGSVVKVTGLSSSPQLNGMLGVVFRVKANRMCVQLLMRTQKIEVQPENLRLVDVSGMNLPPSQWAQPPQQAALSRPSGSGGSAASAVPVATAMATAFQATVVAAAEAEAKPVPSMFNLPAVQALLGGEARARQTLQHFQEPLLWNPADPSANWEFANFMVGVVVGLRSSGVFVPTYPECGQVRTRARPRTRTRPIRRLRRRQQQQQQQQQQRSCLVSARPVARFNVPERVFFFLFFLPALRALSLTTLVAVCCWHVRAIE
jgi:hypothetical protein